MFESFAEGALLLFALLLCVLLLFVLLVLTLCGLSVDGGTKAILMGSTISGNKRHGVLAAYAAR